MLDAAGVERADAGTLCELPGSAEEALFVAFHAPWCEVSREAAPVLARLAESLSGRAELRHADADALSLDAERLKVGSVPTVVLFARGREVARRVGLAGEDELLRFAEEALAEALPAGGDDTSTTEAQRR
jgi:thioredoxin-like negative regulator of GroEL